jgi:hypothetical protein
MMKVLEKLLVGWNIAARSEHDAMPLCANRANRKKNILSNGIKDLRVRPGALRARHG